MGFTPEQFAQMRSRLSRPKKEPAAVAARPARRDEIIIGIDPSLRGTGYGVIHAGPAQPRALAHGTIKCPASWERSRCLTHIAQTVRTLLAEYRPSICAIEGLFYAQNLQTALIMGEARGAALAALGEGGLEIYEIAPRKVKQSVVGYGAAQKLAVAKMVQRLLQLTALPEPDAADALALALAYAQTSRLSSHKRI